MSAVVYFMRHAGTDDVSRAGCGMFIWSSIRVKEWDNISAPRLYSYVYVYKVFCPRLKPQVHCYLV